MIGATNKAKEKEYGKLLAPYVSNPENLFIVSSDFCHWYFLRGSTDPGVRVFAIRITMRNTDD
jgi:predicted class III extradiol MEMO1 family dioxygenase